MQPACGTYRTPSNRYAVIRDMPRSASPDDILSYGGATASRLLFTSMEQG